MADQKKSDSPAAEVEVEYQDTKVETADNDSSAKELKAVLRFPEDADLHPAGEPKSDSEKDPGGAPAVDPNRPPFATNRPDVPIVTALATGSGQHTPPDPATVDADGSVRPLKAEENQ